MTTESMREEAYEQFEEQTLELLLNDGKSLVYFVEWLGERKEFGALLEEWLSTKDGHRFEENTIEELTAEIEEKSLEPEDRSER